MLTRRCLERMFLLRPSPETNQLFSYILAVAAQKYGILLHTFCVMSDHFHVVLTDPLGNLPAFEQYLDSLVARAFNALYGRSDHFWSAGSYSMVKLETPADVLAKMLYVMANPVNAGLVRRGSEWPGIWSGPERIGGPAETIERPEHFFREGGPMPERVELALTCPPGFESVEALRVELARGLATQEEQAAREVAAAGRSFIGAAKVRAQKWWARAVSFEPRGRLNPRIACKDKWKRIQALQQLVEFHRTYRAARTAFVSGARNVLFPYGTYWLRVFMNVRCATG